MASCTHLEYTRKLEHLEYQFTECPFINTITVQFNVEHYAIFYSRLSTVLKFRLAEWSEKYIQQQQKCTNRANRFLSFLNYFALKVKIGY